MKKLKLDPDRLEVESFEARPERADREGTVQGYRSSWIGTCYPCTDWDSCGGTCPGSCWC